MLSFTNKKNSKDLLSKQEIEKIRSRLLELRSEGIELSLKPKNSQYFLRMKQISSEMIFLEKRLRNGLKKNKKYERSK